MLLLLFAGVLQCQPRVAGYALVYKKAEQYYRTENPSVLTDSLAFANYTHAAALLVQTNDYNSVLVDCYLKAGIIAMADNNRQQEALSWFNNATTAWHRNSRLPGSLAFLPYLYAGSIWYNLYELDSAILYYKKADDIITRYGPVPESERLYNKFGALYYDMGDLAKSIPYFEKALALVTAKHPPNSQFFIVNYRNNIATALLKMGNYQQALAIYQALLPYGINTDQLNANIASIFYEQNKMDEALQSFRKVKSASTEHYNHLTMVFLKIGQYDSANFYNAKATSSNTGTKSADKILTLKYAADLQLAKGNSSAAVGLYQRAIQLLVPGFTANAPAANPSAFTGLQHFALLFDVIAAKAKALAAADKAGALAAYSSALLLARYTERSYGSDEAKLFLKNKTGPACQQAVSLALQLNQETKEKRYLDSAFLFAENYKASVLQAGLQQLQLEGISGLPAGLLANEKKYKSLLARLSVQQADSSEQTTLQQKQREAAIQLATVQQQLNENPAYHRLKFAGTTPDPYKLLPVARDQALLSYFYNANTLYCFYSTPSENGCVITALPATFTGAVQELRRALQQPGAAGAAQMNGIAQTLSSILLHPVMEKIRGQHRLIVIPYNEICYVPFEMLIDKQDGGLLLRKFAISYNYSANFLTAVTNDKPAPYAVLAMTPFIPGQAATAVLPALPSAVAETAGLPGKQLTGAAATKEQFLQLSSQYPIIHLATHAVATDNDLLGCYIEFYGVQSDADSMHRLYAREIYNLNMQQAGLVVLSACETGNGQLLNGEGIESLSRAFSYAGCQSVVTSLWKADDAATAFIMKKMHGYLQQGLSKDIALQQARLDYLADDGTPDRYKTPAYWANLVIIGNLQPVAVVRLHWQIPVLLTGLALIAALFFYYKKKRA